jgi:hypothetical protein
MNAESKFTQALARQAAAIRKVRKVLETHGVAPVEAVTLTDYLVECAHLCAEAAAAAARADS